METTTGQKARASQKAAAGLTQAGDADKDGITVSGVILYESGALKELKISTGRRIAADMSRDPLQIMGDMSGHLLQAVRAKCLDCCNGQKAEVRCCQARDCPLYPFRTGLDSAGGIRVKVRARARQKAARAVQEAAQ